MLKPFCDVCGTECDVNASGARAFDVLSGRVGVQVIPTFDGVQSPTNHVCINCIPNLLLAAAKTFEMASAVVELRVNSANASALDSFKRQLETKFADLAKLEKIANDQMKEAEVQIADAKDEKASYAEKLKVLEAQIQTAKNLTVEQRKRMLAASTQALIDLNDDPEAVESINKRERLRASK